MMTIAEQLQHITKGKKIGLMAHAVIGYPTSAESKKLVMDLAAAGADFIELQIPFSDPIADGPTIMQANDVALQNRISTQDCFDFATMISRKIEQPLLFMSYYNKILNYGVQEFCNRARQAGVQGLIVPDLPVDEDQHEQLIKICRRAGLHCILVVSPNISPERLRRLAPFQDSLIYCTSRSGTTGVQKHLNAALATQLAKIRRQIKVPIAVGFGISHPEHVQQLSGHAEIAVVGSAIIKKVEAGGIHSVKPYLRQLKG